MPASPPSSLRSIYSPLQKDRATFIETAAESGGLRTYIEVELAPGGGNAPHRHLTYAEHFQVLEGRLTVGLGGLRIRLGPGEAATAPAGAVHHFANDSEQPVRFTVELTPGHAGFEKSLQVGYGLQADGRTDRKGIPRNPLVLGLLLEWSDMGLCGPQRALMPLASVLAAIARRRGLDRELEARYVHIA
jgi:quercetin dioxygenase-like cupin family protein